MTVQEQPVQRHKKNLNSEIRTTLPETIIKPSKGWVSLQLKELWAYRELLYFFVWRDIKVRYKQTVLGASWAIIQPFLTMVVFSLFFGRLAGLSSDGLPYPIWSYAAMVPWQFFTNGISQSSSSLVSSANMIKKIFFPRLVMPVSAVLAGLVDFMLALSVLVVMMPFYGFSFSWRVLWLPLFLFIAMMASLGVGFWLSAMNVQFRDVRYTVPFITQFWMFASPIAYSSNIVPEMWRPLYAINPMVSVVDGFRWALLDAGTAPSLLTVISFVAALLLLVSGAFYFRRMEKTFADVV
jgi:lipopolysaccharide transport system permease protein